MRFDGEIVAVHAGLAARVDPETARPPRNEGDEPVELWAISRRTDGNESTKIDTFREPSPQRHR
jgi:hypothetical protein